MTKFLTLMNPSRTNKQRKKSMATKSRPRSRSRARRPARATRPAPPRMTPAMRAKVSAGVRRYFAAKKARRSVASVARVSAPRRRSSVVRYSAPSAPVRRSARRSYRGSSSFGGNPLKALMSRDTLKVAGGAVAAGVASEYVISRWGASLPGMTGSNAPYVQTAYRAAIPLAAAYLVRKWDRRVAEGLVVGAAVMVINDLIRHFMTGSGAQFERMGLAGELKGFAATTPTPARLEAIRRVRAARGDGRMNGFRGTVEDLATAAPSPAFSRGAF